MEEEVKKILMASGLVEVEKWGTGIGFAVQDLLDGVVVWPMVGHNFGWPRGSDTLLEQHTELYQLALLPHREYTVTYCPRPRERPFGTSSITVFKNQY
jgi:hypothetical protein